MLHREETSELRGYNGYYFNGVGYQLDELSFRLSLADLSEVNKDGMTIYIYIYGIEYIYISYIDIYTDIYDPLYIYILIYMWCIRIIFIKLKFYDTSSFI